MKIYLLTIDEQTAEQIDEHIFPIHKLTYFETPKPIFKIAFLKVLDP
jgi:hypothetical protein